MELPRHPCLLVTSEISIWSHFPTACATWCSWTFHFLHPPEERSMEPCQTEFWSQQPRISKSTTAEVSHQSNNERLPECNVASCECFTKGCSHNSKRQRQLVWMPTILPDLSSRSSSSDTSSTSSMSEPSSCSLPVSPSESPLWPSLLSSRPPGVET
jgi:hypothetical protein